MPYCTAVLPTKCGPDIAAFIAAIIVAYHSAQRQPIGTTIHAAIDSAYKCSHFATVRSAYFSAHNATLGAADHTT